MNHGDLIYNFVLNILLNNSVILHNGNYEAESPDELALLNGDFEGNSSSNFDFSALVSLGYSLAAQELDSTTVSFPNGQLTKLVIRYLETLMFSSSEYERL